MTLLYFASPNQHLDSQPTDGIWQHSEANKFKAFFTRYDSAACLNLIKRMPFILI